MRQGTWLSISLPLLMLLAGCMGGGTLATGIGEGYGAAGGRSTYALATVSIHGRILDAQGKGISGATISAVTSAGASETASGTNGIFTVEIDAADGASIELNVNAKGVSKRVVVDPREQANRLLVIRVP